MYRREFIVANEHAYDRRGPVHWVWSHAARYPLLLIGLLFLGILSSVLGAQAPLALGRTFDHVLTPARDAHVLLVLSLTTLGLWLGQAAMDVLYRTCGEFLSRRVERDVRDEFYLSLLGKSLTFHSRQRIGDLMARATGDVRMLNFVFSPGLRVLAALGIQVIVTLATIASIHGAFLLVPAAFLIVLAWTLSRYARQINPIAEAQRAQLGALSASLAETIAGIEVVKSYAQEAREEDGFTQHARHWRDLYVRWGEVQARYLPVLVSYAALAAGLAHGLAIYARGVVTLGAVVAYLGLLGQFGAWSWGLADMLGVIARGMAGARRMLDLINTETELDENPSGVAHPIRGEVRFENVGLCYDGRPALKAIDFCAQPGEMIAIVGETGAGKTTLTRLIGRIYDPTEGRVLVDGVDLRDWNMAALRAQIAGIEQDITLDSRSIADNIAFGVGGQASSAEIERCAREAQAHEFIIRLEQGYDSVIGERGVTLSGGERQRIAIARALLANPRILILDDATSAIDSATEDAIQAAISRARHGRTMFLVTHRLSQIRRADRILVLQRGELADQGTHDELMSRCPCYRRLFVQEPRQWA